MGRRSRGSTIGVSTNTYVDVDVDVEVGDLTDDDLDVCIEEARKRGLLGPGAGSRRDRLALVYEDLVARRFEKALSQFEAAIFSEDDGLLDCYRALQRGEWSAAICFIDSAVFNDRPATRSGQVTAPTFPADSTSA